MAALMTGVTHIEVAADVRYWEDARVNGVEDEDGSLIPGRDGETWWARIRLADGVLEGWPAGTTANIHYKVCDAGMYWLTDASFNRLAKYRSDYVPDALCHGDNGYGDYIILKIDGDGRIQDYERPVLDAEMWPALPTIQTGEGE